MDLLEYQGKQLFARHGVPVPNGRPARTVEEALAAADEIGYPCVVKAQVQIGGRGKAGGIKLAANRAEAEQHATNILGMDIRGFRVRELWVEEASEIASEYYASVIFDRSAKAPLLMLSTKGGMDIEAIADEDPDAIARLHVDPLLGFQDFHGRRLAFALGLSGKQVAAFGRFVDAMYRAFLALDCAIVEINPLVVTGAGEVVALDAKVSFDDNALYRHPDLEPLRDESEEDPKELEAAKYGLSYVALDGVIGCMVNGAGLAMATMDIIKLYGSSPANFLDVGGGATKERVTAAFKIILSDPNVEGILVNIFGGIMRCDIIAEGVVAAAREVSLNVPLVVRLEGTNVELGKEIMAKSGLPIISADNLADAAEKVVRAVKGAA